jgi:hypothetical protein
LTDILVTFPIGTAVVGKTLFVGITLCTHTSLLDANFLGGVTVESDSAVITGDDVNIFVVCTVGNVSGVLDHARKAECNVSPRALEVEANSSIDIETMA